MHIIKKGTIDGYAKKYPDSKAALNRWYLITERSEWKNINDMKESFSSVDFVGDDLYVFDITNNYRLIARIFFKKQLVYIRFIGTHAAYDKVDLDNL